MYEKRIWLYLADSYLHGSKAEDLEYKEIRNYLKNLITLESTRELKREKLLSILGNNIILTSSLINEILKGNHGIN